MRTACKSLRMPTFVDCTPLKSIFAVFLHTSLYSCDDILTQLTNSEIRLLHYLSQQEQYYLAKSFDLIREGEGVMPTWK